MYIYIIYIYVFIYIYTDTYNLLLLYLRHEDRFSFQPLVSGMNLISSTYQRKCLDHCDLSSLLEVAKSKAQGNNLPCFLNAAYKIAGLVM